MSQFEKLITANNDQNIQQNCQIKTYAFLQQKQTVDFLGYLSQSDAGNQPCLYFNAQTDDNLKLNKKAKKFTFDAIYNRTQKIKFQFYKMIKDVCENALKGQNQSLFIYGTQQKCKDKILFGQSQNHGIFLCILSQLFQQCHIKALEDEVTIKFSCALFNNSKFIDLFSKEQDIQVQFKTDVLQGGILQSVPEVIIRNVKTGLKLINIALKEINDIREEKLTQNLIFTLKLQLDCKKDKEQISVYCISKINFIKLANPSINCILKGINKNNVWFVNLFNYIQAPNLTSINNTTARQNITNETGQQAYSINDEFTKYLQQICFKGNHKIFGFVSISNKMTSNQCLTALLFANYIKSVKLKPKKYFINLPQISSLIAKDKIRIFQSVKQMENVLALWVSYLDLLPKYMNELNYLQFQYSLVIGQACEKLNKYIFTEQLQDFFYAKKINIQNNQDLTTALESLAKTKRKLEEILRSIAQKLNENPIKDTFIDFLNLNYSLAHHFLLDGEQTSKMIYNELQKIREQKQREQNQKNKKHQQFILKYAKIVMKQKSQQADAKNDIQNSNKNQKVEQGEKQCKIAGKSGKTSIHKSLNKSKESNNVDYLQCMFKNKNVGLANKKF